MKPVFIKVRIKCLYENVHWIKQNIPLEIKQNIIPRINQNVIYENLVIPAGSIFMKLVPVKVWSGEAGIYSFIVYKTLLFIYT